MRSEGLRDFHCVLNTIPAIEIRGVRWAGNVALTGKGEVNTGFSSENILVRGHLEDGKHRMGNNIKMG